MPRLSAAAAEHRWADLSDHFATGIRLSSVLLIPATVAYIALGQPLAVTIFQWGRYAHVDAMRVGTIISVMAIGLVPFAISQMQLFTFYAMPDTRTPALMNIPVALVRVACDVIFYFALPYVFVAAGLLMANTISYSVGVLIGYRLLRGRIGADALNRMWRAIGKLAAAGLAALIPTWLLVLALKHMIGSGKAASIAELLAGGVVLVAVYLVAAFALKATDVTDAIGMIKRRLGRS
jgi:putative peptidoglycan lipid II flippase